MKEIVEERKGREGMERKDSKRERKGRTRNEKINKKKNKGKERFLRGKGGKEKR